MNFLDIVKSELEFQKHLLRQFNALRRIKDDGQLFCKRTSKGYTNYYIKEKTGGEKQYVRKKSEKEMGRVCMLQAKGLGTFAAERTEKNIKLLNQIIKEYQRVDAESILRDIPEPFKGEQLAKGLRFHMNMNKDRPFPQSEKPTRREDLKHSTSFGLCTRSKNEAMTAELLYAAGVEFYYERKLVLVDKWGKKHVLYPDFTIILADGTVIYWEHKGMLDNQEYVEADNERMQLYYINGIYQPHNLIVTGDGPSGEYCGAEISMIVNNLLAPLAVSRF